MPQAFADKALYTRKQQVPLFCALAISVTRFLFPKPPGDVPARCDVPRFFAATYFSDDGVTARQEFHYRYRPAKPRLWQGVLQLDGCLDLTNPTTLQNLGLNAQFLVEDPYFPWHFVTACALSGKCDSICYKSFRGPGVNYAVFAVSPHMIVGPFKPAS